MKKLYSAFGAFRSSTKENRLIHENQNSMRQRLKEIYGTDAEKSRGSTSSFRNSLRAKYSDLAKDSVRKPFGGRADAPPIDEDYAEALSRESIRRFLDGDTLRKDPEMGRILKKAFALMELYQTRAGGTDKLTGLVFGWEGKLVVKDLDTERQNWAIDEVDNQIKYLQKKKTPAAEVSRNGYESEAQFRRRIKAIKDYKSTSLDQDPDYKRQQIGDWEKIRTALQEFNNDYKFYREIRENLTNNPGMLRQVEKKVGKKTLLKWGKKYPDLYRKAVRESAKLDPTILEGRENDFVATGLDYKAKGMDKYFKMLTEALEDQPLALKYYPVRLKRLKSNREIGSDDPFGPDTKSTVGLPDYQDRVVENIGKAPRELLEHVLSEYNKYWKSSPDKFKDVVVAAVGAQPDLFWTDWNKSGKLNDMKNVFERIGADARGQVIGSVKTLDQLRTINAIASSPDESGIGPYLTNPAFSSKQLSSIGGNKDLMRFLKFAQPDVYTNIVDQIKDSSDNPDMAKLAAERHITGEDKSLGTLMAEIIQDYNPRVESLINWERNRGAFLAGLKYMPNAQFEMVIEKGEIPVEFLNGDSDTLIELYKKISHILELISRL